MPTNNLARERRRRYRQNNRHFSEQQQNIETNSDDNNIEEYNRFAENHIITFDNYFQSSSNNLREEHLFGSSLKIKKTASLKQFGFKLAKNLLFGTFKLFNRSANLISSSFYYIGRDLIKIGNEAIKSKNLKQTLRNYCKETYFAKTIKNVNQEESSKNSNCSSPLLCSVCIHNNISMISTKCAHASLCEECALQIINNSQTSQSDTDDIFIQVKCPICRQKTTFTKIIYSGYDSS